MNTARAIDGAPCRVSQKIRTNERAVAVRRFSALGLAATALVVAILFGVTVGPVAISPVRSAEILLNATGLVAFPRIWPASDEVILLVLRLPRVLGAVLVGAALGTAGTLFQGVLRNPLADPLLLGISAGAALGATLAFLLPSGFVLVWYGFSLVALCAFVGAIGAVSVVYVLATRRGRTPVVTLLLAGVAVSAVSTAMQNLLIIFRNRGVAQLVSLFNWLAGGVNVGSWTQVAIVAGLTVIGIAGAIVMAPALDAFALGEEMALHLGFHVEQAKLAVVLVASLLVASAVSISGLVGFVGLVAPHLCRLALGPLHRTLVPASALTGALFVVASDMLARSVAAPTELPLGVVTALVGAPFFLWLLRRAHDSYSW